MYTVQCAMCNDNNNSCFHLVPTKCNVQYATCDVNCAQCKVWWQLLFSSCFLKMHCAMFNVSCTKCNVQCEKCKVQCAMATPTFVFNLFPQPGAAPSWLWPNPCFYLLLIDPSHQRPTDVTLTNNNNKKYFLCNIISSMKSKSLSKVKSYKVESIIRSKFLSEVKLQIIKKEISKLIMSQ